MAAIIIVIDGTGRLHHRPSRPCAAAAGR